MNPAKWLQLPRYHRSNSSDASPPLTQQSLGSSDAMCKPTIPGAQRFAAALSLLPYPSPETPGNSSSQDTEPNLFRQSSQKTSAAPEENMHFALPSPSLSPSPSQSKRRPRKLRKPPPSAYPIEMNAVAPPLSFVPDEIPSHSNFPDFNLDTSPPGSPRSSSNGGSILFIPTHARPTSTYSVPSSPSMSMRSALTMASHSHVPLLNSIDLDLESRAASSGMPRKLTKRRPTVVTEAPSSYVLLPEETPEFIAERSYTYPPAPQPSRSATLYSVSPQVIKPPQRRSTLSLGFRSRKHVENKNGPQVLRSSRSQSVSESGHSSSSAIPIPPNPEPPVHPERPIDPRMDAPSFFKLMPHETRPYRGMASPDVRTHEMSDLVWTGRGAFPSTPAFESPQSKFTLESPLALSPIRPALTRRHAGLATVPPRRRWTLASVMSDEEITDEVLVEELERMRRGDDLSSHDDSPRALGQKVAVDKVVDLTTEDGHTQTESEETYEDSAPKLSFQMSAPDLALIHTNWHTARRALLTCRELVRTERHYLSALQSLALGETSSAPPPLMLRYVKELVNVSNRLLARLESDPSAWGVAAAFMSVESDLENAFSEWCAVVGTWFQGNAQPGRLTKSRGSGHSFSGKPKRDSVDDNAIERVSPLRRASMSWRKSSTSIHSLVSDTSKSPRTVPVRDLAILPTQRIMRYVLLYKDLLAHTPVSSPSRPLVECALEASCRIADKCDRAQSNTAFSVPPLHHKKTPNLT